MKLVGKQVVAQWMAVVMLLVAQTGASASKGADLDELIERSGLERQAAQFSEYLQMAMAADPSIASMDKRVVQAIVDAFEPQQVVTTIRGKLAEGVSRQDVDEVLQWYRSGVWKQIVAAEVEASRPEIMQQMMAYAKTLDNVRDADRVALMVEIDRQSGASELQVKIQSGLSRTLIEGVLGDRLKQDPKLKQQIEAVMEQQMGMVKRQIREMMLVSLLYTYREVGEAELGDYIVFAQSGSAKRLHQAIGKGYEALFIQAGEQIGKAITASD